jgi:hypothetical protein
MTRKNFKRGACTASALVLLSACGVASGHTPAPAQSSASETASQSSASGPNTGTAAGEHDDRSTGTATPEEDPGAASTESGSASATAPAPAGRPGTIKVVRGTPVENVRQDAAPPETSEFCDASDLEPGEGVANKANTCVSTPIGEVAEHPVRVSANAKFFNWVHKPVKVKILVADDQGVLDLNAFTFDETGGAGTTLHEHPGELDESGRPLAHCHLGVTTLDRFGALPGEDYDAAFSGIQGFKGDLTAEITGLPKGSYRGDVYCSGPGHPALVTNVATRVQAFDVFEFKVIGR